MRSRVLPRILAVLLVGSFAAQAAAQTPAVPAPPPPPGAIQAPPVAPPPPDALPVTVVSFRPSADAALQRRVGSETTGYHWESVCLRSCIVPLDPRLSYRVGGDGVVESDAFLLAGSRMTLDVEVASRAKLIGGFVMGYAGGGLLLIGASIAGVGAAGKSTDRNGNTTTFSPETSSRIESVGLVTMLVGAGLAVGGAFLFLPNYSTKVTIPDGGQATGPGLHLGGDVALTPSGLTF